MGKSLTEFYQAGFCKAAFDAGFDPKILVKEAQKFRTHGFAPASVSKLHSENTDAVPNFIPSKRFQTGYVSNETAFPARDSYAFDRDGSRLRNDPRYRSARRYQEWVGAHLDALEKARKAVERPPKFPGSRVKPVIFRADENPKAYENAARIYHQTMNSLTNAPSALTVTR